MKLLTVRIVAHHRATFSRTLLHLMNPFYDWHSIRQLDNKETEYRYFSYQTLYEKESVEFYITLDSSVK